MARLTPISRERLIRRPLNEGVQFKTLAAQAGISLRCACKWLARYRSIAASRSGVDR
ncbi:leucine zipper domain-containing protein [Synechococcus sp. BA-120 BA3]|nr:leucine zipper domain-containing protein [Synechococcus sp. BA-120 BA3]